uniref:hypothetical protein n=1 Tax=Candidatus Protochlamydia sp. R18 TaxID=1353977 RepID=UPI001D04B8B5
FEKNIFNDISIGDIDSIDKINSFSNEKLLKKKGRLKIPTKNSNQLSVRKYDYLNTYHALKNNHSVEGYIL